MIKHKTKLFLIISLLLNIILLFSIYISTTTKNSPDSIVVLKEFSSLTESEKQKIKKANDNLVVNDNNYLFLGDSITFKYDLEKYYGNMPVVNSGVNGNRTEDIMRDIKKRVYDYNPSKIFILIGTNQLVDQTNEEIFEGIIALTKKIHKNRKHAQIYVESIYPINGNIDNKHTKIRDNNRIRKINKMLQNEFINSYVKYIDVYSELADEEGNLKEEYTYDALHLTDEGYQVVTKVLKKYM